MRRRRFSEPYPTACRPTWPTPSSTSGGWRAAPSSWPRRGPRPARVTAAVNHALPGLVVTLSSGTAHVPDDGNDPDALYRLADARLYRSKRG